MADGRRVGAAVVLGLAALAVLVLLAAYFPDSTPDELDVRIAEAIYDAQNPGFDLLMRLVSIFGSPIGIIVAVGVIGVTARRWGDRRGAMIAAGIVIAAIVVSPVLKLIFARPRPELIAVISAPRSYAFPSGHTVRATAAYAMAAVEFGRMRPQWRVWMWPAVVVLVALVGVSRVYLGAHWPSDVAAGWAFGVVMVCIGCWALGTDPLRQPRGSRASGDREPH